MKRSPTMKVHDECRLRRWMYFFMKEKKNDYRSIAKLTIFDDSRHLVVQKQIQSFFDDSRHNYYIWRAI
jgi:hypothetical protein